MAAYLIARVRVDDPEGYKAYALKSKPAIEAFGGKFIARGGETEILEGEDNVTRVVLVEFPDMDTARRWYASEQYQETKAIRAPISNATFTIVEGA